MDVFAPPANLIYLRTYHSSCQVLLRLRAEHLLYLCNHETKTSSELTRLVSSAWSNIISTNHRRNQSKPITVATNHRRNVLTNHRLTHPLLVQ